MKRTKLIILFTLLLPSLCTAAPIKPLNKYALTTWTTDQGLPQNFITAIAQTPDGFLWVGTMGGLARFDGLHFKTFPAVPGSYNLQTRVTALATGHDGTLWIGTTSGLTHLVNGTFTPIPNSSGSLRYNVTTILPDLASGIYAVTYDHLFHVDNNRSTPVPLPSDGHAGAIRAIAQTPDRTLWIASIDGLISVSADSSIHQYNQSNGLPSTPISILYSDTFGSLYAGDGHRLLHFVNKRFESIPSPGQGNFVSLLTDHNQNLWMASGGLHGISRNASGSIEQFTAANGLSSNDARILFEDNAHDIWIGTIAGLQRLHDGAFTTYDQSDGLPGGQSQYDAVFEDKNHDIWVGSLEDGIARFHDGIATRFSLDQGLKRGQVRGFADTPGGLVVAVADYGLFQLHGNRFTAIPNVPHGYITSPVSDGAGGLWFSVSGNGIFHMHDGVFTRYTTEDGVPDKTAWALLYSNGELLAGTAGGLAIFHGNRFERIATGNIVSICKSRTGALWLGTNEGLVYLKDGHSRLLAQPEGIPGNQVFAVAEDASLNLWIATANAIARLNHEQIDRILSSQQPRLFPKIFTRADGLKSSSVLPSGQVSITRASDGRIWFTTSSGLSVVDPHLTPTPTPSVFIDSLLIDDLPQAISNSIVIPPGRHRLTFSYTAPELQSPAQLRFRYRLIGWDKDWLEATSTREISYTNLPPATYRLEIAAANENNLWSTTPATASMRVRPFFYQTRTFVIVSAIALIAIIVEITRRRTRIASERLNLRFQERVAERERIAYQIHDTVIQDLVGSALQLELIGMQLPEHPDHAGHLLQTLAVRMREMVGRSRRMVSSLHSTATPAYDLMEVLENAASEFRMDAVPELHLHTDGVARDIHPFFRDEVYRICREALANAFRHANATLIEVRITFHEKEIEVTIDDNGDGMDEDTRLSGRQGHFGLPGMRAHAERIGAAVTITSEPARGTTVRLVVPTAVSRWRQAFRNRAHAHKEHPSQ